MINKVPQTTLNKILEDIKNDEIQKIVVGAVILIEKDSPLLLKRKSDDFMGGLIELPSGTLEPHEDIISGLIREIKEETNCDVVSYTLKTKQTILFSDFTPEYGQTGVLQHTGTLFDVTVSGTPTTEADGLDSNGALWIDTAQLSAQNATPFLLIASQ